MLSLMKYFFFLVLCGLPLTSVAQKMVIGTSQSFRQTQGRPYEYADSVWVDSSRLTLFYRHERMVDSTDRTMRWSLIRMRIGEGFAQQTDMHIYLGNRRLCAMVRNQDMLPLDYIGRFGDNNPPYWADMILDRRKREMKITCCNFYSSAGPLTYREDMPELTWDLLDGTEEVCGYECHMAQTSFRGRIWKAWYSTELHQSGSLEIIRITRIDTQGDRSARRLFIRVHGDPLESRTDIRVHSSVRKRCVEERLPSL